MGTQSGDSQENTPQWKIWFIFSILAILFHLLLLLLVKLEGSIHPTPPPPPVEVHTVDPFKLQQIRRQWREKEKALLMNTDPNPKDKAIPAPKEARYMSDRNIRVEKEQRARQTVTLPKPGGRTGEKTDENKDALNEKRRRTFPKKLSQAPRLSDLGVHFGLDNTRGAPRAPAQAYSTSPGGQQFLIEPNLPEGSENMLNTEESTFYAFYARMYEKIAPIFNQLVSLYPASIAPPEGQYIALVEAILDRDGNLVEVKIISGSGLTYFDDLVIQCWTRAKQFQNPPHQLVDKKNQVHVRFNFLLNIQRGPQINVMRRW